MTAGGQNVLDREWKVIDLRRCLIQDFALEATIEPAEGGLHLFADIGIETGRMWEVRLEHDVISTEQLQDAGYVLVLEPIRGIDLTLEILARPQFEPPALDQVLVHLILTRFEHEGDPANPALDRDKLEAREAVEQAAEDELGQTAHVVHEQHGRDRGDTAVLVQPWPQGRYSARADVEVDG